MTGKLLIAHPSILQDMVFGRAVILIAEHNFEGTIGFILNKPTPYTISELIPDMDVSFPISKGWHLEQEYIYYIRNKLEINPNSNEIAERIFWCGNFEIVKIYIKY